ncbi:targeting protein for Xklp2 isoform X1 [Panthera onca]|uniref:targeting protein for Xklp2 isoform X1 n=1 Tax=Panthera onca TaxID=9690 RepID=UPI002954883E|nr:targeting protein for Xklp2 isoform X1 [Panthera onca]XP_060470760.1 targeting protein for Xklp2 isoform X1 [Panthera onca]XP_060470770.1 targeting protein for Xklp2 isoform X1 [Panthera onca]XP_060470773.1 targeting protein for Xklp2 isoform X1 [Panthera onca]XP_060470782.1 targeting protein for Xklp2 isoform X1 [Panthera onca]XP_060470784.1 targeting protein for Xklp2 isoform X1 [Panthera onca]XP_060470793.1 targeting protein for Xklp2 isoform X1 [Panthera onca]XP_060470802.1 targeting 
MSQVKTSYSYDAPTDFINFTSLDDEEDTQNIDSWFEEKANLENKFPGKNGIGGLFQGKTPLRKPNPQQAIVTPLRPVDNTYYKEAEKENLVEQSIPSNAASSLEVKGNTSRNTPAQPQRRSTRLSAQKDLEQKEKHHVKMKAKRCATPLIINEIPPSKKMKVSNKKKKPEEEEESSAHQDTSEKHESSPEKAKGRHTVSCIPPVRQKILKSTEEQELEKRMKMQQEVMEMRKKNEEFKKLALAGIGQPVKKSVSQVTKSVDFHFRTDERIKQHPKNQEEYKEVNFTSELRKHPPSPARVTKGCTIIKPFNLSQGKKRTFDETTSTYVPLAQQVEAFHKRTPNRYHLRSKKDDTLLPSKSAMVKISRDPQTPVLQTKQRTRPVTCKSAADQEAEELEKLQQYKFKARELDPRILEGGPILPKKPPVKPPTQPIGFDLEIEKRIQERESKKKSEDEHFEFHSRPCPTKILEDVVGVPEKKVLPITVPKSPAFALKNRIRMPTKEDEEEEEPVVIRAQPVPHYGVPFKPQIPEARTVEICPFSFDSRDKERQLQKEKKIKELQKGEVPKFKALPLPHFDTINLPEKKVKNTTQIEPFCLETDRRGALKAQTWKHQLEEELKQQKEAACFKARPNTVISQEPFVPKKEKKSVAEGLSGSLVQEPFQLATEKRAKERQELEKRMAEVEAQKVQQLEEARHQEEEQQREELSRLRKELVHKANPIRKYQGVEVKSSDQPLTVPVSPKFSTRFHC